MAIAISNSRTATPYLYQESWGNGFGGRVCGIHQYLTSTEFKEPGLQLPLCFFCSQRLRQQTMFFRIALIARGPKVEHDEGQKHVERYIEVAHVYV